ncbi:LacI family DNA-binding transcriptional regulator [uncultured Microbacterium sp.]|uniref:LacI family DNA-binding transcriptional regulator n=1 Tax=uncultured Microbacterium sp. TaxID=191216 RepID=UPI0035C9F801
MPGAIADVAVMAGVSKATASRALSGNGYVSEETRGRVLRAAAELGYVPSPLAASLVTKRTKSIAIVSRFASRWYFGEILEGIEAALLDRGYDLTLYNLHPDLPDRDRLFDYFLARKRLDGMIAIDIQAKPNEQARLSALGWPIVAVGGNLANAHTMDIDDVELGRRATEHLIELGHRRIAHLTSAGADERPEAWSGRRLSGYLRAIDEAGLWTRVQMLSTEHSLPSGYESGRQFLSANEGRPTAIFAATDEIAFGVILAARELGIGVPDELSVIGIDGHEYSSTFGLTTFEQRPHEQGIHAANILAQRIEDTPDDVSTRETWPTRLILRGSTAPPARTVSP